MVSQEAAALDPADQLKPPFPERHSLWRLFYTARR
jgi:hypothetical protein